MKIFQVGGSVRDEILGVEANDKDWVVVGSSPEKMIAKGFKPIGKDFPVFLHPNSNEEYALARTERKSGKGYKGFTFYYDETVTLEEDLKRRDFTINSIAKDENGSLLDPHGGLEDLKNRIFRQTSESFSEDPLRSIRYAKFKTYAPTAPLKGELWYDTASSQIKVYDGSAFKPTGGAKSQSESNNIPIRSFDIIYTLVDEIKVIIQGLKGEEKSEVNIGSARILEVFPRGKVQKIAGVRVSEGKILRNARIRLVRNSEIIFDGGVESMRHLTQNVTELTNNLEGGIVLNGYHEIEVEDILECYELK